jgi:hypothetical protein
MENDEPWGLIVHERNSAAQIAAAANEVAEPLMMEYRLSVVPCVDMQMGLSADLMIIYCNLLLFSHLSYYLRSTASSQTWRSINFSNLSDATKR